MQDSVKNAIDQKVSHCLAHEDKELVLYCETCGELVCYKCVTTTGKHRSHDYEELNVAFEKYKEEITSSLEPMEKQVTIIREVLALIEQHCGKIMNQRTTLEDNIHVTFRKLREVLTVRETELIGQLHQMTQAKLKDLAAQSDQIETTLTQLSSCLHFMRESVKEGNENDVLKMKTNTVHKVKKFTTQFQAGSLTPNTEANMVFSALADLTAMCQGYGQVFTPSSAVVREPIAVKASLKKLGTPILTLGEMGQPHGIAINQRRQGVVVTEMRRHCVSVFSPKGKKLLSFGSYGSGRGQFKFRVSITLDAKGSILVADSDNHRIQKFTADGQFLAAVGTMGSGPLQFHCPTDIAFNTINNKVYVIDSNNRVQVLNSDLTYSSTFGKQGNSEGQFKTPWGIACDRTGKVYVADIGHCHIQVFTARGKFLKKFGRSGRGEGELARPCYVAVDTSGVVYVSDVSNHRISVFDSEGRFVTSFGRKGKELGEFSCPQGLAVDDHDMYMSVIVATIVFKFFSNSITNVVLRILAGVIIAIYNY